MTRDKLLGAFVRGEMTAVEVGLELGVSRQRVYQLAKEYGHRPRSRMGKFERMVMAAAARNRVELEAEIERLGSMGSTWELTVRSVEEAEKRCGVSMKDATRSLRETMPEDGTGHLVKGETDAPENR